MEGICEKFNDYAETTTKSGTKSVVRTSAREGKVLNLNNISINRDKQKFIRYAVSKTNYSF